MGFKQRERKRKKKAAQIAARKSSRNTGSAAGKWWRTVVTRDTCCARCGGMLRRGRDMVYRAIPREALCLGCANKDEVACKAKPSLLWEAREATRPPPCLRPNLSPPPT